MLKKKKISKIFKIKILTIEILFSIVFLVGYTQATVKITSKIQWIYEKIKNNPSLNNLPWWSVSDIYKTSLNIVKENDFIPLQEALVQTRKEINKNPNCNIKDSDILNIVFSTENNKLFMFQWLLSDKIDEKDFFINEKDFIESCNNIMICKTEKPSKPPHSQCINTIQEAFLSAETNIKDHQKLKMWNYWKNFFQNANSEDSSFDLLIDIETIGNLLFKWFEPSNKAEVLFYKMPEKSDTNNTPQIWDTFIPTDGIIYPSDIESNNDINRFNIWEWWYPATGFQCPENIESATHSFSIPEEFINNNSWNNQEDNTTTAQDLENILNKENEDNIFYVKWVGTIGNLCNNYQECGNWIIEWTEDCDDWNKNNNDSCQNDCKYPTISSSTTTPQISWFCWDKIVNNNEECDDGNNENADDCLNTCKKNICGDWIKHKRREQCDDKNTIWWDGCSALCQLEKSPYCGDGNIDKWEECDDGNNNNNDSCLNTCKNAKCWDWYIYKEWWNETCDDGNNSNYDCCSNTCQNEWFITPEEMFLGNMLNSLDTLTENKWPKIDNSCLKKCKDLPISDRILCSVECSCWEISSQKFGSVEAGAFRLKYCMIPAESVEVEKESKTIFSIEEIFTELKNLLMWLRDSWELIKTVETKEMLESSMIKNDFSKMFAFNANISFKSLMWWSTKKNIEKNKATNLNNDLKLTITNISKDPSLATEKNKYVIAMDIAGNRARLKEFDSIEDFNAEIDAETKKLQEKIVMWKDLYNNKGEIDKSKVKQHMQDILNNDFTSQISEELLVFLSINHKFRDQVNYMFENINWATELLRTKIESWS